MNLSGDVAQYSSVKKPCESALIDGGAEWQRPSNACISCAVQLRVKGVRTDAVYSKVPLEDVLDGIEEDPPQLVDVVLAARSSGRAAFNFYVRVERVISSDPQAYLNLQVPARLDNKMDIV